MTEQGMSPDQIVTDYPRLSLGDVYAALAFYHDHRELIDRQMQEQEAFVDDLIAKHGFTLKH